ncbi:site-specific integrase [Lacihabitans soyangensis]|uniref:Site-specific integrase n=1 Tax=Lacihabitans soyangensis TaxID=869394 RepID=A0AAE3H1H1_9BACT|nr:site-specific integrase [Lacihabitans soyangensis]MCP9762284.1 site-specific integrase [Lacihabitans soyangensis]
MKVNYDIVFDIKKEISTKKKEKGLVQIRAYYNGSRKYFTTRLYLKENEWDFKKNQPKDPVQARSIRKLIDKLEDFETQYRLQNDSFHLSNFDIYLKPKKKEPEIIKISFSEFFKMQLTKESQLKRVTLVNQINTLKKLTEFKKVIQFEDLNYQLIQDFEIFLRQKKNLRTNTIEKYHRQVRKYINLAIKQDLFPENKNPYKNYKLTIEETDTIFLLPEERQRVENLIFEEPIRNYKDLEMARDMFLFGCYTGLRYSDCFALTADNFNETENGLILKFRANKTNKIGSRPLYLLFDGKPEKIIKKYLPKTGNQKLFKGMNNPKVNRSLKVIAEMANVHRGLYFKASRDTFGTTLYMLSGDDKLVQKQLQHSKRDQTDKYVHLVEQIQNEGLQKIFKSIGKGTDD